MRTTADAPMPPDEALKLLKEGNARFIKGEPTATRTNEKMRQELVDMGQAPHTAIIGCADSRAPLETIFDALPGDIFVLRNAGNTCTHAEGSMVGSLEFCTGKLGARMILVLGHTKCGAVYGATNAYLAAKKSETASVESALEGLLLDLAPVAEKAVADMGCHTDADEVAAHAVRVNVFHTIDFLLKYSAPLREKVKSGQVEIQGGIYHLDSGKVEFMGRSPQQSTLLSTNLGLPPSMTREGGRTSGYGPSARGEHGVRTTVDSAVPAEEALKMLKAGNERFAVGAPLAKHATLKMREALVSHGQAPHTAILGCADSRVPVDTVFDAMPGDLFVLRNAGNTCTHAEGSMVGSLEFCCGKLGSKLILVMGHTKCGAIAGATATYLASKEGKASKSAGSALEGLLVGLSGVAKQAEEELGVGADQDQLVSHSVRVNVFSSIEFLLKYSPSLRELVKSGNVEIQGGIYHLETGRVEFLGRSPRQAELLRSDPSLPPSLQALPIRTTTDGPLPSQEALKLLKEGNARFTSGAAISGKITPAMRKALVKEGQAPHTAIIGCADSRAPLETVFDAMPGDIFVLRNAGNTCTHAEGSMVGSLEFCTGKLGARMILVLGHTKCGAVYGATNAYLAAKKSETASVESALEGLLLDLAPVAEKAVADMGCHTDADEVAAHAVRVNVFHTIDFLLKYSAPLREKVKSGQVEIQGGIYHLDSGKVEFMGRSPQQSTLLSTNLGLPPSMTREGGRTSGYGPSARGEHGVRTTVDSAVPAEEALKMLKAGNERFAVGAPLAKHATLKMREALVSHGQAPHTAILGCADSRVPVDTVFDAMPGDLFVLRNAGNTCTHAEGSMVGSLEFCCGKLGSKLILVMGHTKCGAIAGATATYLASKEGKASKSAGSALEGLLVGLSGVAKQAEEELGVGADQDQLVSHSVRVNVFSSIEFLLKYSPSLRELVKSGNVEIQGGIYHLETGRVEFLGRSPRQAELLRSDPSLPPSLQALPIRTTTDGPLPSQEALKLLKEGNARFTSGAAISGKITPAMRKALVKEGQAPHTAIIGCADSRAPLETVFDAMPGDIFVLRNAGNTCTHAEGSVLGSLEFCVAALQSKMVLVLGHTACGAIKGATATYLQAKSGNKPQAGILEPFSRREDVRICCSI